MGARTAWRANSLAREHLVQDRVRIDNRTGSRRCCSPLHGKLALNRVYDTYDAIIDAACQA